MPGFSFMTSVFVHRPQQKRDQNVATLQATRRAPYLVLGQRISILALCWNPGFHVLTYLLSTNPLLRLGLGQRISVLGTAPPRYGLWGQ